MFITLIMIRIHRSDKVREPKGKRTLNRLVSVLRQVDLNCTLSLRYVGILGIGVNLTQGEYSEAINFSWEDIAIRNESKVVSRFVTYLEKIQWQKEKRAVNHQ